MISSELASKMGETFDRILENRKSAASTNWDENLMSIFAPMISVPVPIPDINLETSAEEYVEAVMSDYVPYPPIDL